jgi:hypothetical protein
MGRRGALGGVQERCEFTAVHAALGRGMDPGSPHVLRRVRADATVDVGEAVVAADRREPPVDGRWGEASFLHPGPVQLDVRSSRGERGNTDVGSPLEVTDAGQRGRPRGFDRCSGPGMPRLPGALRREAGTRHATPAASSENNRTWTSSTSLWVDHQHRAGCQLSNDVHVDMGGAAGRAGVRGSQAESV